jgi:hypothetical protein
MSPSALRRHGHLLLAAASVAAMAALLVGAEAALRRARPDALLASPAGQPHVRDERYGWALRPGWTGRTSHGGPMTVNARGYRGAPLGPRTAGRKRVLLLGDSITFGTDVADGETFAARLPGVGPFDVANRGVSGYGTDQALLLLEQEGFGHEPDVVVLNVCLANDLVDNLLPTYLYDGVTPKPRFVLEGESLRLLPAPRPGALVRLQERSFLFDTLVRAPGAAGAAPMAGEAEEHWQRRKRHALERFDDAARLARRLVAHLAERCAARGVPLLVALHPDRPAFLGDDTVARILLEPADGRFRVLDLREAYRASGLAIDALFLDKSGHLTPQGHGLAAEALAPWLTAPKE